MGHVGGIVRQNAKTASWVHDIIVPEICITRTYLLNHAQQKYFVWQVCAIKHNRDIMIVDHDNMKKI